MALLTSSTNKSTKAEVGPSSFLVLVLGDLFNSQAKECKVDFFQIVLNYLTMWIKSKTSAETISFKMNPK